MKEKGGGGLVVVGGGWVMRQKVGKGAEPEEAEEEGWWEGR